MEKKTTFRKGLVGDWKENFSNDHIKLFKDVAQESLEISNYEKIQTGKNIYKLKLINLKKIKNSKGNLQLIKKSKKDDIKKIEEIYLFVD